MINVSIMGQVVTEPKKEIINNKEITYFKILSTDGELNGATTVKKENCNIDLDLGDKIIIKGSISSDIIKDKEGLPSYIIYIDSNFISVVEKNGC